MGTLAMRLGVVFALALSEVVPIFRLSTSAASVERLSDTICIASLDVGCGDVREAIDAVQCLLESIIPRGVGPLASATRGAASNVHPDRRFMYGEAAASGLLSAFTSATGIGFEAEDVFIDFGSGTGRLVLALFLLSPLQSSVGIELEPKRHKIATDASAKLMVKLEKADASGRQAANDGEGGWTEASGRRVRLVHGDMLAEDIGQSTVIFTNSLCFPQELLLSIASRVIMAPPGTVVLSLQSFKGCHPGLVFLRTVSAEMSWEKSGADVHIYVVAPPPSSVAQPLPAGLLSSGVGDAAAEAEKVCAKEWHVLTGQRSHSSFDRSSFISYASDQPWAVAPVWLRAQRLALALEVFDKDVVPGALLNVSRTSFSGLCLHRLQGASDDWARCAAKEWALEVKLNISRALVVLAEHPSALRAESPASGELVANLLLDEFGQMRFFETSTSTNQRHEDDEDQFRFLAAALGIDLMLLTEQSRDGRSLLHAAVGGGAWDTGSRPLVQLLALRRAELGARDNAGRAPLHHAAKRGNAQAVKALLEAGCPIDDADDSGFTALHLAARRDIIVLLIASRAAVEAPTLQGRSALHLAADLGRAAAAGALLDARAALSTRDNSGRFPLHAAALRGHVHMVGFLLASRGDPVAVDGWQQTPLHVAEGQPVIEALLRARASPSAREASGRTALHFVAARGLPASVMAAASLIDAGGQELLEVLDDRGLSARDVAAEASDTAPPGFLELLSTGVVGSEL